MSVTGKQFPVKMEPWVKGFPVWEAAASGNSLNNTTVQSKGDFWLRQITRYKVGKREALGQPLRTLGKLPFLYFRVSSQSS